MSPNDAGQSRDSERVVSETRAIGKQVEGHLKVPQFELIAADEPATKARSERRRGWATVSIAGITASAACVGSYIQFNNLLRVQEEAAVNQGAAEGEVEIIASVLSLDDPVRMKAALDYLADTSPRENVRKWAREHSKQAQIEIDQRRADKERKTTEAASNPPTPPATKIERRRVEPSKQATTQAPDTAGVNGDVQVLRGALRSAYALVVARKNGSSAADEQDAFWRYYHHDLIGIENRQVEVAMVRFGRAIKDGTDLGPRYSELINAIEEQIENLRRDPSKMNRLTRQS